MELILPIYGLDICSGPFHNGEQCIRRRCSNLSCLLVLRRVVETPGSVHGWKLHDDNASLVGKAFEDFHFAPTSKNSPTELGNDGGRTRRIPSIDIGIVDLNLRDEIRSHEGSPTG